MVDPPPPPHTHTVDPPTQWTPPPAAAEQTDAFAGIRILFDYNRIWGSDITASCSIICFAFENKSVLWTGARVGPQGAGGQVPSEKM